LVCVEQIWQQRSISAQNLWRAFLLEECWGGLLHEMGFCVSSRTLYSAHLLLLTCKYDSVFVVWFAGGLTVRQSQVVGNLQRIRAMVKHHVAKTDESRTGQFLSAAAKGQADRVKLLLQQGYNPNTTDYDKRTALMLATANGHRVREGRNSSSSSSSSSMQLPWCIIAAAYFALRGSSTKPPRR